MDEARRVGFGMIQIVTNRQENIVIRQRTYGDCAFVDARLRSPGEDGEPRPTRQRVTIALDWADDLAEAIRQVARKDQADDD
jgi:hypothetical protein